MMNRAAVNRAIRQHITNEIVVASFTCAFDWLALGERALNYFSYGAMGLGTSHALGLAVAQPERKVVVLEGDGSLLMNLGTLVTIAAEAPHNLVVFTFQNNTYEANGGHPIPRGKVLDFAGIARSCGIDNALSIDKLVVLERQIPSILAGSGPTFVSLQVAQNDGPPRRDYELLYGEARREALRAALNARVDLPTSKSGMRKTTADTSDQRSERKKTYDARQQFDEVSYRNAASIARDRIWAGRPSLQFWPGRCSA